MEGFAAGGGASGDTGAGVEGAGAEGAGASEAGGASDSGGTTEVDLSDMIGIEWKLKSNQRAKIPICELGSGRVDGELFKEG